MLACGESLVAASRTEQVVPTVPGPSSGGLEGLLVVIPLSASVHTAITLLVTASHGRRPTALLLQLLHIVLTVVIISAIGLQVVIGLGHHRVVIPSRGHG